MISWNLIFLIVISLTNLFLGFFVLIKGKRGATTLAFFFLVIVIVVWSILNYLCDEPSQVPKALFWNRSTVAAGFIQCITALYFVLVFPEQLKKRIPRVWKVIFSIYGALALITLTTNLIVKDIEYFEWGTNIVGGKLYFLYSPFILFTVGSIIFLLVNKYREFKNERKKQIAYILFGTAGYLLIVVPLSVLLPVITGSNKYAKFSPYAWFFFLFFTALAITRYHLFGIEVILTEILVGIIGILLVVQIFTAPTVLWRIVNSGIFVLFCIFGYLLIRGVFREIKRREEAEKLSRAKSEFIAIASHQLRTPLSTIKGYLSMILEGNYGKLPEKIKEKVENVYQSNERLIKLVNDVLSVSKIEAGETEMNWEKEDLREIIKEVISELSIKAREKNLYLKFEEPKEFPKILLDREKIRQVILNLVDNAIRYTQKGGVTVRLQIGNGRLQIVVSDTGEGLTKEEKEKLFERFSRGTAGTKFWTEGAGLGLYIARRFVEMHKGKIWAESEGRGKGSTFYVELPMR
jgi:signal transduction histidine kinase